MPFPEVLANVEVVPRHRVSLDHLSPCPALLTFFAAAKVAINAV